MRSSSEESDYNGFDKNVLIIIIDSDIEQKKTANSKVSIFYLKDKLQLSDEKNNQLNE